MSHIVRFLLFALAAAAAWYVGSGFARLNREWQSAAEPPPAPPASTADFAAMASALPLSGQWSFAETDWNLRSQVVKAWEVPERLKTLAATLPGESAAQLPDLSPQLSEYVSKLKLTPTERAGNKVYLLDKPTFKAELVVRNVGGTMKTVGMAVGLPTSASDWQVFELSPTKLAVTSNKQNSHLLPLPEDALQSAGRFADDGTLLLEFVDLKSNADALFAQWKEAGWQVRPSGLGGPNRFSYLCARGHEVVYVWSANSADSIRNLMLVRTPEAEDTKP